MPRGERFSPLSVVLCFMKDRVLGSLMGGAVLTVLTAGYAGALWWLSNPPWGSRVEIVPFVAPLQGSTLVYAVAAIVTLVYFVCLAYVLLCFRFHALRL